MEEMTATMLQVCDAEHGLKGYTEKMVTWNAGYIKKAYKEERVTSRKCSH
jgi:hypothetical protein